ncbi:PHD-finger [Popillia japonica]|uniref:PHD-finger n=1 Tax=Popillia japonica TaxID=7064 RepID=A0AAW1KZL3_POPJA
MAEKREYLSCRQQPMQQNGINEILYGGCDLGFHLECLTPPLSDVPEGLWFCPECGPEDEDNVVDVYEIQFLWSGRPSKSMRLPILLDGRPDHVFGIQLGE